MRRRALTRDELVARWAETMVEMTAAVPAGASRREFTLPTTFGLAYWELPGRRHGFGRSQTRIRVGKQTWVLVTTDRHLDELRLTWQNPDGTQGETARYIPHPDIHLDPVEAEAYHRLRTRGCDKLTAGYGAEQLKRAPEDAWDVYETLVADGVSAARAVELAGNV